MLDRCGTIVSCSCLQTLPLYSPRFDGCLRTARKRFVLESSAGPVASVSILHLVGKADLSSSDIKALRRILREKEDKS